MAKILLDKPAPHMSAQSWVVFDSKNEKLLFGRLEKERREVASLTKIMTAYTVLQLADSFAFDWKDTVIEIDDDVNKVPGTTADLATGDKLTVEQLLYGCMLPSGNDAAKALAKYFGNLLLQEAKEKEKLAKMNKEELPVSTDPPPQLLTSSINSDSAPDDNKPGESQEQTLDKEVCKRNKVLMS